jgi:hypothetical protein
MNFDTTYLLEEFRAIQPELFDESGTSYRRNSSEEQMLKLINALEQEVIRLDMKLKESSI